MPTRPCCFCLVPQGESVFADFDTDDSKMIALRRISFDGFGCCRVKGLTTKMSRGDSGLILTAIARDQLETEEVEKVLFGYFRENLNVIWKDALQEHGLV